MRRLIGQHYVVPNVLSPRDLVFRPDSIDETVPHMSNVACGWLRQWFYIAHAANILWQKPSFDV